MDKIQIAILAAGRGSRMKSDLPKVMHEICGKPMIEYVIANAGRVSEDLLLVYSPKHYEYFKPYAGICRLVPQEEPLGTARAVYSAFPFLNPEAYISVLYGDNPLIFPDLVEATLDNLKKEKAALTTLAFKRSEPSAYGRIKTSEDGAFLGIVEFRNADEEERKIDICNSGVMFFAPGILNKYIAECSENMEGGEAYLTKIVEIAQKAGEKVSYFLSEASEFVLGVNDSLELASAEKALTEILKRGAIPYNRKSGNS